MWGIPQCTCGTSNDHPEHTRAPACPVCEGTGASQSFLSSVDALPLAWMPQELPSKPNECHAGPVPDAGWTPRPCNTPILPPREQRARPPGQQKNSIFGHFRSKFVVQQLVLHGILHPMLRSCLLLDLLTVVDVYFHSPFAFEDVVQFFLSGFAISAKSTG